VRPTRKRADQEQDENDYENCPQHDFLLPVLRGGNRSAQESFLALKPAEASLDAMRSVLQAQIDTLRTRGISWSRIGDALGVSRQAARELFS
jgi:hypothetical protein